MNLKCERKVSWILQVTIWSQNIWYWFKRKTNLLLCFKVTKGILIANIFWPFKDHAHRNKINEKADIMNRIRKTITEKLSSQSQSPSPNQKFQVFKSKNLDLGWRYNHRYTTHHPPTRNFSKQISKIEVSSPNQKS